MKAKGKNWLMCLGVGEGRPDADRFHSSFLYNLNGTQFLVDAGEPAAHSLKKAGVDFSAIERVFITHTHPDHFGAIVPLIQAMKHEKRRPPLSVHLPKHAIKPLRSMLEACYVLDERLPYELQLRPWKKGKELHFANGLLKIYPTTHLEKVRKFAKKYPKVSFNAFALRIETSSITLVHSGDLGAIEDLSPLLEEPVDFLACELTHAEPQEVFQFLRDKPVKQIAFIHVAREHWSSLQKLQERAKKNLIGKAIAFPKDGQVIPF